MLRLLVISLFLTSCASASDWSSWKTKTLESKKMTWSWCVKNLHGQELHEKGICYATKECRTRTTIFNNPKEECRPYILFCKWGDIACMREYDLFNKSIK